MPLESKQALLRFMPKGIRSRLFLLIALVLLPLVFLLGWIYFQRFQTRLSMEIRTQLNIASVTAGNFELFIDSVKRQSQITGKAITLFEPFTINKAESVLLDTVNSFKSVRNMSWVSPDGNVVASSEPEFVGSNLAHRDYFQRIVKGNEWAVSDLLPTGTVTPRPTVAVSTGIYGDIGILKGVIVAGIEPNQLYEATFKGSMPEEEGFAFLDSKGVVVFRCPEIGLTWEQRTGWLEQDPLMQAAMKTKQSQAGFAEIPIISPGRWVAARTYMPQIGWYAATGRPDDTAFGEIRHGLVLDGLIAVVVCSLSFLLAYLFSRMLSGPIVRLQSDTKKMGRGEIRKFEDPYAPAEVQNLREQVESMAENLFSRARELHESEETMRGILNSTYDAILLHDESARIIEANRRFEELYAVERAKALKLSIAEISGSSAPLELLPDIYRRVIQGEAQLFEWKARRIRDGEEFDVEVYLNKLMMHGQPMILATMRDITQRKKSEQRLIELTNDLKAKNEELESIINITSHDLKSPVVNIMGFSGELTRSVDTLREKLLESDIKQCQSGDIMAVLDKEIPEEMEFIKKSTRSIDQMLASLSKVVHTVLAEIHITHVNVNELISSILSGFKERIEKEKIDITMEILPECLADRMLLREIFFNVIENAITYLVPERPGKIFIGGYVKDNMAVYFIKDNGRGIAAAHQENIFKLFHKLDTETQGEGIGLTVSRRLVERQSGSMWVESEPDKGSTFYIQMPYANRG